MKRTIWNLIIWLLAGVLMIQLFQILNTESPSTIPPTISTSHPQEMAALIQEHQQLEKELQNLALDRKKASEGPASIFVMINTPQEEIIREAAEMMDQLLLPALLGVSQKMLEDWAQQGVPAYVAERLTSGWEL